MGKIIKCPYCGDTWEYFYILDNSEKKVIVTKDHDYIEDGSECTCFKCGGKYKITIKGEPERYLAKFVYDALRRCKG